MTQDAGKQEQVCVSECVPEVGVATPAGHKDASHHQDKNEFVLPFSFFSPLFSSIVSFDFPAGAKVGESQDFGPFGLFSLRKTSNVKPAPLGTGTEVNVWTGGVTLKVVAPVSDLPANKINTV